MRRSLAEAYEIVRLCPLCMVIGSEGDIINHLIKDHTDEEMLEQTGWDIKDFEEEDE